MAASSAANTGQQLPSIHLELSALSAHIAVELALGLSDAAAIKERYEISDQEWDKLKNNPAFRAMVKEAVIKTRGDLNAGRRITIKSEIALEDSIPILYQMIHDKGVPAASRVESMKGMAGLAGRNMKDGNGNPTAAAGGFAININIETKEGTRVVSVEQAKPAI